MNYETFDKAIPACNEVRGRLNAGSHRALDSDGKEIPFYPMARAAPLDPFSHVCIVAKGERFQICIDTAPDGVKPYDARPNVMAEVSEIREVEK